MAWELLTVVQRVFCVVATLGVFAYSAMFVLVIQREQWRRADGQRLITRVTLPAAIVLTMLAWLSPWKPYTGTTLFLVVEILCVLVAWMATYTHSNFADLFAEQEQRRFKRKAQKQILQGS